MATQQVEKSVDADSVEGLNERLAEAFRTNDARDIFTADVFFDLNMPVWRFQMEGVDAFESWRRELAPKGSGVTILQTVPTLSGFVTEYEEFEEQEGELMTSRKMFLCEVRDGRIAELVAYCTGGWDEALRARHAVEAPMIRP